MGSTGQSNPTPLRRSPPRKPHPSSPRPGNTPTPRPTTPQPPRPATPSAATAGPRIASAASSNASPRARRRRSQRQRRPLARCRLFHAPPRGGGGIRARLGRRQAGRGADLAETLFLRAIVGQTERVTRADGEVIERHRYDNRLATSLLNRLDRPLAARSETAKGATRPRPPTPPPAWSPPSSTPSSTSSRAMSAPRAPACSRRTARIQRGRPRAGGTGDGADSRARPRRPLAAHRRRPRLRNRHRRPRSRRPRHLGRRAMGARRGRRPAPPGSRPGARSLTRTPDCAARRTRAGVCTSYT